MSFKLPELGYEYNALEPYIDAQTMEIHHTKHHAAYLREFNVAIENTELENKTPSTIFSKISEYSDAVRNNGGGFFNHAIFWQMITPNFHETLEVHLADAITKYFGTLEKFKEEFAQVATSQFGAGWAWLIKKSDGELIVSSTPNQDNPLMDTTAIRGTPILCLDVWEHAYYLNYQNKRPEYINAFWKVVNWDKVAELFNRDNN